MNPPPVPTPATIPAPPAPASTRGPLATADPSARPRESATGPGTRARIAVLGASGYTGQEFTRLALAHPGLEIVALSSREHAGRPVSELLPGIDPRGSEASTVVDPAEVERLVAEKSVDTLVACLPHGAWRTLSAERPGLVEQASRIIDLSSDFRDGTSGYVYGLPEAFRDQIKSASRITNPGCYATAGALALLPAAALGWLGGPVMVSALSGVSGAGRSAQLRTSFVELDGGAAFYRVGTEHAHVAEMERTLSSLASLPVAVGFAPQLAPMARGILLTASAPLARPVTAAQARRAYLEQFGDEPFVRVLDEGQWPETRTVRTSNRCDLAVTTLHGGGTLLVAAALDNLVKGAAGQAIQNLNLMLRWPEDWGLPVHGSPW